MFSASASRSSLASHNEEINEKFFRSVVWLFFVDIISLNKNNTYKDYETREQGYAKASLEAYQYAFSQEINNKLTPEYILDIHARILSHLPNRHPGHFKKGPNKFPFSGPFKIGEHNEIITASNPNGTLDGFWEFVENWLIQNKEPLHFIHLKNNDPSSNDVECYLQPVPPDKKLYIIQFKPHTREVLQQELFNPIKHRETVENFLLNIRYQCIINSTADWLMPSLGYKDSIEVISQKNTKRICDNYNLKIIKTTINNEKLRLIIETSKQLSQLHPLGDGHTRLCYLLINRLLDENRLTLTILPNPNRLEGFTVDQLMGIVKKGQEDFLRLCSGQYPTFEDEYTATADRYQPLTRSQVEINAPENVLSAFVKIAQENISKTHTNLNNIAEEKAPDTSVVKLESQRALAKLLLRKALGSAYENKHGTANWVFNNDTAALTNTLIKANSSSELQAKSEWFKSKFKAIGILDEDIHFNKTNENSDTYQVVISNITKLTHQKPNPSAALKK